MPRTTANTRTKAQVERDRVEVARLYLQGKFQCEIGEILGVSQQQISWDLAAIQRQWRELPQAEITELRAKELAKIDLLEQHYWQAWEDSKRSLKSTSTGKDGEKIKLGTRSQERNGNPQFLQGVERCISARVRMLGLDAPVRNELTGSNGGALDLGLSETTIDVIKYRLLGISSNNGSTDTPAIPTKLVDG